MKFKLSLLIVLMVAFASRTTAQMQYPPETKNAPILDANKFAIDIMQRATKLPDCDWGLEYTQGASASIAYAPRARALSRLNTLEGMRQLASGNTQSATDTWLAGVRFSQDLARGGSLIFTLMAKNA